MLSSLLSHPTDSTLDRMATANVALHITVKVGRNEKEHLLVLDEWGGHDCYFQCSGSNKKMSSYVAFTPERGMRSHVRAGRVQWGGPAKQAVMAVVAPGRASTVHSEQGCLGMQVKHGNPSLPFSNQIILAVHVHWIITLPHFWQCIPERLNWGERKRVHFFPPFRLIC